MQLDKIHSGKFKVLQINKQTSAQLFCGFKIGDEFTIEINMRQYGATYVRVTHLPSGQSCFKYLSQIFRLLNNFILEYNGEIYDGKQ